jgi:hypothetical protein
MAALGMLFRAIHFYTDGVDVGEFVLSGTTLHNQLGYEVGKVHIARRNSLPDARYRLGSAMQKGGKTLWKGRWWNNYELAEGKQRRHCEGHIPCQEVMGHLHHVVDVSWDRTIAELVTPTET